MQHKHLFHFSTQKFHTPTVSIPLCFRVGGKVISASSLGEINLNLQMTKHIRQPPVFNLMVKHKKIHTYIDILWPQTQVQSPGDASPAVKGQNNSEATGF